MENFCISVVVGLSSDEFVEAAVLNLALLCGCEFEIHCWFLQITVLKLVLLGEYK